MSHAHLDDRAGPPHPTFRFLADEPPTRPLWLWPRRVPLGCLTLLVGDPGTGKSLLTVDLAARLTCPHPWPDDPACERPDPASLPPLPEPLTQEAFDRSFPPIRGFPARRIASTGVVFVAPEDRDALSGRLAAAGADRGLVSVLDGVRPPFTDDLLPLRLPAHAGQLREAIRAHDHPRLVVLDPLHALLDTGVHSSPDRQADLLAGLADLARRTGVALLAVAHFTKSPARRVMYRIRGSVSLIAAARSVLLLTADPHDADRRILSQVKSTYAPLAPPLAFRIVPGSEISNHKSAASPCSASRAGSTETPIAGSSAVPPEAPQRDSSILNSQFPIPNSCARLDWSDAHATDWRLSTGVLDLSAESFSALSEACDWLTDFLSAGPRPARELLASAHAAGIPRPTLLRAKRLLNIASKRTGLTWSWLPCLQPTAP